jgi:putative tryptophan/tyrosine transport system substrate-binding protein
MRIFRYSDKLKPVPSASSGQALSKVEGSAIENRKSKIGGGMKRFVEMIAIFAIAAAGAASAEAQQLKPARIALLIPGSAATFAVRTEAFRQGLRELGYTEGQSVVLEYRYADGRFDRLPELAAEMLRLNPDIVVTSDTPAVQAVKKLTSAVPIVMGNIADPVAVGLVASLARPGGNITGLTTLALDLDGKRLELLKEIMPRLARVSFLWDPTNPAMTNRIKEVQAAARALNIDLQSLEIRNHKEMEGAFDAALREKTGALLAPNTIVVARGKEIADFAAKNRLAVVYDTREFIESGGLMSYGPSFPDLWRRAASYVDKILKGAKPADLPVEQPTKFELVINLKTAKQIGVGVPPGVLARADRVIK